MKEKKLNTLLVSVYPKYCTSFFWKCLSIREENKFTVIFCVPKLLCNFFFLKKFIYKRRNEINLGFAVFIISSIHSFFFIKPLKQNNKKKEMAIMFKVLLSAKNIISLLKKKNYLHVPAFAYTIIPIYMEYEYIYTWTI